MLMKEIVLTQGKVTLVDDAYFVYLSRWSWCAHKSKNRFYAVRTVTKNGRTKQIAMHRVIAMLEEWDAPTVDHKNLDGLDNQIENLRPASMQQQNQNKNLVGSTGFKGVSIISKTAYKPYKVTITNPETQEREFLGTFFTPEEGARMYDFFARKYFKEFARLNFPKEGEQGL
jgi:hypothetical protein